MRRILPPMSMRAGASAGMFNTPFRKEMPYRSIETGLCASPSCAKVKPKSRSGLAGYLSPGSKEGDRFVPRMARRHSDWGLPLPPSRHVPAAKSPLRQ
jgi:hypothetical protein